MAKRNQFDLNVKERITRTFSEGFKRQKVKEILARKSSISEVHKQYNVSYTSLYRWIRQYGVNRSENIKMVVETESDTRELLKLKKIIAELEQLIGQKQVFIEFQQKMIDLAEETYGVDIKKKFSSQQSSSFGNTESKMPSL
jgi:transposase-like protein